MNEIKSTIRTVRQVARASSGLSAALILYIFIGETSSEGFEPFLRMSIREALMMFSFAALWLGLLLGWRWEIFGGALTIGGLVCFYLIDFLFSGNFPSGPFFIFFASPSLLFLYCGLKGK